RNIGIRHRRRVALASGSILLLIAISVGGFAVTDRARQINWLRYEPTWWLTRQIDDPDLEKRWAVMEELSDRLSRGKISSAALRSLNERLLAFQQNRQVRWDETWGEFLQVSRSAGK